jgi:GTP cyclohydrolase I
LATLPANPQIRQPAVVDYDRLLDLGRDLLLAIGEDPNRPGLLETPRRWASLWREFIEYEPGRIDTSFETVQSGQMVLVSGMRVFVNQKARH